MLLSTIGQYIWYCAWDAYARLFDQLCGGDRYERYCVYLDRKAALAQERVRVPKSKLIKRNELERNRREQFAESLFTLDVMREALTNPNFVFPNSTKQ